MAEDHPIDQYEEKILGDYEEAPHIELNQDGATIDLANWNEPANRNWSYRHAESIFVNVEPVSRGGGPLHEFGNAPADISSAKVTYRHRDMPLDEYLYESHCDALLVLKGNDLVYENYRRMAPNERHLCQSVSKTTVCATIGDLVVSGAIDPQKAVEYYISGVGSGWRGVKVQDLLDMNTALMFDEDFTSSESDIHEYEMLGGWHPDSGGQAEGVVSYLKSIEHNPDLVVDDVTHYLCPNTDMLGLIIATVTGRPFVELFQDHIYRHLGAEADAYFSVDAKGVAVCSGGLIVRPRDLARYGQLFANRGRAQDGAQVIPERWIVDCQDVSKGTDYYLGEGFKYHNQMTTNGRALCHLGVGGQMLYANPESQVVVVQFSTTSMASNGDLDIGNALYGVAAAIDEVLDP